MARSFEKTRTTEAIGIGQAFIHILFGSKHCKFTVFTYLPGAAIWYPNRQTDRHAFLHAPPPPPRSEERRVGKEC